MNNSLESTNEVMPSFCPMDTMQLQCRVLNANDELLFPMHKKAIVQYSDEEGLRELHLYYGDKEISFDEPELFEFGENLVKHPRFIAQAAMLWGDGYEWSKIKELLEQLIDEGILHYADTYDAGVELTGKEGVRPSPLPPAMTTEARNWMECPAMTQELAGRSLELGYLELVIPVFRVAHIMMDAEGRQVGEANVFPRSLRLDIPTDWRVCNYPGSRYQDDRPMNVTALKSMRAYWSQMMVALLHIREVFLQRFPSERQGWTVGGLEALSALVLAVPTYQLVRMDNPVDSGQLNPALSSMFRVTDGLRMVTHQMMFVPFGEPTIAPKAAITSAEIYEYSERNHAFSSDYGVCAGPKMMIEEFLNVLVNGMPIKESDSVVLEPAVLAALDDIKPAFDYGLYGLQVHAVTFSFWPMMTRTYAQLWGILDTWPEPQTDTLRAFKGRIQTQNHILTTQTYHAKEEWRINREHAYSEIYAFCAQGLGLSTTNDSLIEHLTTHKVPEQDRIEAQLHVLLKGRLYPEGVANNIEVAKLGNCLMNFFKQTQAIINLACETQQRVNHVLGRTAPSKAFDVADMNIHNLLQGNSDGRLAFLITELEEIFSLKISITLTDILITDLLVIN